MPIQRLQWMTLWDQLRDELGKGNAWWGRNQILAKMDELERKMIRDAEMSKEQEGK